MRIKIFGKSSVKVISISQIDFSNLYSNNDNRVKLYYLNLICKYYKSYLGNVYSKANLHLDFNAVREISSTVSRH